MQVATDVQVFAALKLPGTPQPGPVENTMEGYADARREWHKTLGVSGGSLDGWNVNVAAIVSVQAMDVLIDSSIAVSEPYEIGEIEGLYDDAGFVVLVDGKIVSSPMCCSSFGESLRGWRNLAVPRSSDLSMLWVGHPWQMVRVVDDMVELSDPTEADDYSLAATFPINLLVPALRRAESDLREFVLLFAKRVGERGFDGGVDFACRILGIGEELFAAP